MPNERFRSSVLVFAAVAAMISGVNAMAAESDMIATSAGKPVALGAGPVSVTLAPSAGKAVSARVAAVGPGRKVYLVVRGLGTNEPPEVLYQVYLGLPPGAAAKPDGIYYAGSFNFFNAMNYGGAPAPASSARFYSFDVTDLVNALQSRKSLGDSITVTIVPTDMPRAGAKPVVGEIALVEQ